MSQQDDDTQNFALMVLAGIILLVIGGVILASRAPSRA